MQVEEVLALVARVVEGDAAAWEAAQERTEQPRLTLTYAQSIDGSIAAERGKPTILSGPSSMKMTHILRTLHDGIMVGIGTILADNPSLNARFATGKNPMPIIVDMHLQCPLDIKLFTNPTCEKPMILCAPSEEEAFRSRKQTLEAVGAKVLLCRTIAAPDGRIHIDLRQAFAQLRREGFTSVMVEGGASIILACLQESAQAHLIDRVVVTVAPTFIGGLHAVGRRVSESGAFPRLVEPTYLTVDSDLVIVGRL